MLNSNNSTLTTNISQTCIIYMLNTLINTTELLLILRIGFLAYYILVAEVRKV